jgi:hypothetical protein
MESTVTDLLKDELINHELCPGVTIKDLRFDNSPADNSGTKITCSGIATLTNDVERDFNIRADLTNIENSTSVSFGGETQESMTRRFLQLLKSGTFSNSLSSNNEPINITFESDYSGYYISRDGDRYSFDYSISSIYHVSKFPDLIEPFDCDDLIQSVELNDQSYGADFTMSNNRFILNGKIKINGPSMIVEISGDIEDNESSRSEYINWTLNKFLY